MSTAYDILLRKVETLSLNSELQQIADKLKSEGLSMSLDELRELNEIYQPVLECFRCLLLFLKYLAESPKGLKNETLAKDYVKAMKNAPTDFKDEVLSFMSDTYLGGLLKEIETEDFGNINIWIDLYSELKSQNVGIQVFEDALTMKLTNMLWDVTGEDDPDIGKCTECLQIASDAQEKGIDIIDSISALVGSLHNHFYTKYEIYNGGQRNEGPDLRKLIKVMTLLNLDESDKANVEQLKNYFVFSDNEPGPILKKNNRIQMNLDNFTKVKTLYATSNLKFSVSIKQMKCDGFDDIVKKVYLIEDREFRMDRINKEINILKELSKIQENSKIETCFLLYYGSKIENNKISIYMQYIPTTLMDELKRMKKEEEKFEEEELKILTSDLLSAFRLMNECKIYHQDIKPHNILFTKDRKLKIIDFSVSESYSYSESTFLSTGMINIQGTQGYMAPEIHKHLMSDRKNEKLHYSRGKADVFSLGLTLLQMYNLKSVDTLNHEQNNGRLMLEVEKVSYHWLATLLRGMLHVNYNERFSFQKCTDILPQSNTTYKTIKTSS